MNKGLYITLLICLGLSSIGIFYYQNEEIDNNNLKRAKDRNVSTHTSAISSTDIPDSLTRPSQIEKNIHLKKEVSVSNTSETSSVKTETHKRDQVYAEFLNQEKFKSSKTVDSVYLDDSEVVYQKAIFTSLVNSDFTMIVEKLDSIRESTQAIEREMKIQDFLTNSIDIAHYDENFSCAGKICAVTFIYENESNRAKLEKFGEFDSNFSFGNFSVNENGENIYKGVFIQTDDPSKLAVSTR